MHFMTALVHGDPRWPGSPSQEDLSPKRRVARVIALTRLGKTAISPAELLDLS